MTKDKALKLALEAIEELRYSSSTFKSDKLSAEAITAIKEALAQPAQQPVEFITPLMEQQMFDGWCPYKGSPDPRTVWAAAVDAVNGLLLGATPPAAQPAQEPYWSKAYKLADEMRRHLSAIPTAATQRPWVGLTIYEMDDAFDESMKVRPKEASNAETRRLFAHAIEAKLKAVNGFHSTEKNT